MVAQVALIPQTGVRRFGSGFSAVVDHVLACEAQGNLCELWHADFALPYHVDLQASGADKAIFVIMLRLTTEARSHDVGFARRLAELERAHFGPSDFAPGGALAGYLAIPATGTRQPEVEAWAQEAFGRSVGNRATDVALAAVLSVARAGQHGPRLVTHAAPAVPPWRRGTTQN